MTIAEATERGIYGERDRDRMNFRPPNGESYIELLARLENFFTRENLLQATAPVVIVSHQGTTRMIAALLGMMPAEKAAYISFEHRAVLTAGRNGDNQIETRIDDISIHD